MKRLITSLLCLSRHTLRANFNIEVDNRPPSASRTVLLDSKNNVLYVSSIDGTPDNKDGNGLILR